VAISLYNTSTITPTGATYNITICSKTSAQCTFIPNYSVTTANQTSGFSAALVAPRFPAAPGAFGYADVEVSPKILGMGYYNLTTPGYEICNGSTCTGDGGGGAPTNCAAGTYACTGLTNTFTLSQNIIITSGDAQLKIQGGANDIQLISKFAGLDFEIFSQASNSDAVDFYSIGTFTWAAQLTATSGWCWNSQTEYPNNSAPDTCRWRISAGIQGVGNGTPGDTSGTEELTSVVYAHRYTVSTLPSAATAGAGATVVVTDASTFTPGTCTGSGSDYMIAVSNGTSWSCH